MQRRLLAELRAERMEVVPQRDDLRRRAGCEQRHVGARECNARRLGRCKHVAGMHDDPLGIERAESCSAVRVDEAHPGWHRQVDPAPLAHLYFAPSTATGISVEYG